MRLLFIHQYRIHKRMAWPIEPGSELLQTINVPEYKGKCKWIAITHLTRWPFSAQSTVCACVCDYFCDICFGETLCISFENLNSKCHDCSSSFDLFVLLPQIISKFCVQMNLIGFGRVFAGTKRFPAKRKKREEIFTRFGWKCVLFVYISRRSQRHI